MCSLPIRVCSPTEPSWMRRPTRRVQDPGGSAANAMRPACNPCIRGAQSSARLVGAARLKCCENDGMYEDLPSSRREDHRAEVSLGSVRRPHGNCRRVGRAPHTARSPERWFADLTERQIRRGVHRSTRALEDAIRVYLVANNANPKPFAWVKTADEILASIARFCLRTSETGH